MVSNKNSGSYSIQSQIKYTVVLWVLFFVGLFLALLCLNSQSVAPFFQNILLRLGALFSSKFPLPDGSAAMALLTSLAFLLIAGLPVSLWLDYFIKARDAAQKKQQWGIVKAFIQARFLQILDDFLVTFIASKRSSSGFYYQFGKCWQYSNFDRDGKDWDKLNSEIRSEFTDISKFETLDDGSYKIKIQNMNKAIKNTLDALEQELSFIAPLLDTQIYESTLIYELILEFMTELRVIKKYSISWDSVTENPDAEGIWLGQALYVGSKFWLMIAKDADDKLTESEYENKIYAEFIE